MQVYVRAKSKRDLNERLASGDATMTAIEYSMDGRTEHGIRTLPTGTVIKIFHKRMGTTPIAKAYGTWDAIRRRVK